ncbi:hypothetical protein [Agrobacterium cavarae]
MEKLQTIATKYRKQRETGQFPANFMRHCYDVYCLLGSPEVREFIGSAAYFGHKERRFPNANNPDIAVNPAFSLPDAAILAEYEAAYDRTAALCYHGRPSLKDVLARIAMVSSRL